MYIEITDLLFTIQAMSKSDLKIEPYSRHITEV